MMPFRLLPFFPLILIILAITGCSFNMPQLNGIVTSDNGIFADEKIAEFDKA